MALAEAFRMTEESAVPEISEALLVRKAAKGDTVAFEALYRRHEGRVYALCIRMLGDTGKAEDCVQETFVQAWRRLDSFQGRSAFGTWLHRIAVNQVLTMQRKDSRHPRFLQIIEERTDGPDTGPRTRDGGLQMDLESVIRSLPEGARNVFVLYAVHGYSHEETAAMLGVAVGTCKAQLHRARRLLADRLDA